MNLIRSTPVCFLITATILLATPVWSDASDEVTTAESAEDNDGVLVWGNGDSLPGRLVSAGGNTLVWKSPLFADPLAVDLSVLSTVRFADLPDVKKQDSEPVAVEGQPHVFCVALKDYSVLFGSLVSIDADSYRFSSERHGEFDVQQNKIRHLQSNQDQGLVYLGPRGLGEWDHKAERRDWAENPDGSLTAPAGDAVLGKNLSLPEQCEIEFQITSTKMPDFSIVVGPLTASSSMKFEVWDDSFVICDDKRFISLGTLKLPTDSSQQDQDAVNAEDSDVIWLERNESGAYQMNFRGFFDFKRNAVSVYSKSGKKLGQKTSKQMENWSTLKQKRLSIEAVEGDLTLRHVCAREWDGSAPPQILPDYSRVQLRDGTVLYGQIQGLKSGTLQFATAPATLEELPSKQKPVKELEQSSDDSDSESADEKRTKDEDSPDSARATEEEPEVREILLKDVVRIFNGTPSQPDSSDDRKQQVVGATKVSWQDGGFLSGKFVAMDQQSITLQTEFSSQPMRSTLSSVRSFALPNTEIPKEEPDRLFFDGGSLRGQLTVEDHEEPIRWTPVGGQNASALVSAGNARFQRGAEPESSGIDFETFPDIIYLRDGDVFPCHIRSSDLQQVVFETPVADLKQLNCDLVKAVEFGQSERLGQRDFADKGWKNLQGRAIGPDKTTAAFEQATFAHDSILTGDCVSFRMRWRPTAMGSVVFHLYADSSAPTSSSIVSLALQPNRITVSDQAALANNRVFFGGFNNAQVNAGIKLKKREVDVELITRDGKLHVFINGKESNAFDLKPNSVRSRRLVVQASIMTVRNGNSTPPSDSKLNGAVVVDQFAVRNVAGASVKQFIQDEARERALTVPRFRRDDPSTHAILAPNGDLLRGRLQSLTETEIVFDSRLETFRFPRSRVSAIISLVEQETEASAREETAVQATLDNGYTLTMTPDRMADGQLVGMSRQLGPCRIPAGSIRDLFLGNPEGREEILSYVRWIRQDAAEPEWDLKEDEASSESELLGQTIEDFELPTLDDDTFRLSDHADKVIVLDFWATWCGPCVAALPEYIHAVSEFDESKVIFVAVNLEETPERINKFLKARHISPIVALDRGSVISKRFGVTGIPHTVVLGPGSVVKHVKVGYQPGVGEQLAEQIAQLLTPTAAE